jgi:hypothetical protein
MGFIVLDPNNDRGHKIDVIPEKGKEYQAVRIFGKDSIVRQHNAVVIPSLSEMSAASIGPGLYTGFEAAGRLTGSVVSCYLL